MSQTAALYHLQTLDSQRDTVRTRLAEIARLLNENEVVRSAHAALEAASTSQREWQTRATDLELKRRQLADEAKAAEDRLYSGKVLNPRELTDLQEKITELGHRRDALEEPLLEAMMESEAGDSEVHSAQEALDNVLADQAQTLGVLTAERDHLMARLQQLDADINQARTAIDGNPLALYDELRKRPGTSNAVAEVRGGECGGCGVEINSRLEQQVRRGEVLACPTCGRIMVIR